MLVVSRLSASMFVVAMLMCTLARVLAHVLCCSVRSSRSPSSGFSQFTAMPLPCAFDRFAADKSVWLACHSGITAAVDSVLVQCDASTDAAPTRSPFTPGVPPHASRGEGWAVTNSIRPIFHAHAQNLMTEEQKARHKFNSSQINKLQRATAFSCSEGQESVWSTPFSS